jgi:excisionase family DNA binding protein
MAARDEKWIGLSEAALLLGVHPSTVRSWADKGLIPVHRTAGGHRRFLRSEIRAWADRSRSGTSEAQVVIENVIGRTRMEVPRLLEQDWYARLTETQREAYRDESRRLLEQVGRFIGDESSEEAAHIGQEYARISLQAGMGLAEAVKAFLFFRGFLLESILNLSEVQRVQASSQQHREATRFTDLVLVALIEEYQTV